jgi:hypothetical protein
LNGENYVGAFAAREEALAAGIEATRESLDPPQTIYVARRVEADPHASGHARTVLREMAWQAHDVVGPSAATYLHKLSDDQVNELDLALEKVILEWLRRNELLPTYFKVEAISEHPVPQLPARALKSADAHEVNQVGETLDSPQ